ncbi:MAG TPA: mechanosensitive ion channel family protein [Methylomirabilota bacterium]|nr:mechanosensitive ion channel family protein [Methylomirabilota bacterium]
MTGALEDLLARGTRLESASAHLLARLFAIAVTGLVLLVAYRVALRLIARLLRDRPGHELARLRTLASLLTSLTRWAVGFIAVVIVLRELGIDVFAILVSAGVLGLAVGFGAQTLIRDIITGFFLLFEGLIHVGDVVQVGAGTGTVESIGLRVLTVRMDDGALRIIPNGQLTEFATYGAGGVRAVVDVPVSRDVPVEAALALLNEVGAAWARESGAALDAAVTQGIMGFSGGDVVLRLTARVAPERRVAAESELRRRIKQAFDRQHWSPLGAAG